MAVIQPWRHLLKLKMNEAKKNYMITTIKTTYFQYLVKIQGRSGLKYTLQVIMIRKLKKERYGLKEIHNLKD